MELWQRIYEQTGVLLTAPGGFGQPYRGAFRLVYSCVEQPTLKVAMERLETYLGKVGRE